MSARSLQNSRGRSALSLGAAAALVLLTGCVRERIDGDASIYEYAWWVPVVSNAVCIVIAAVGCILIGLGTRSWRYVAGGICVLIPALLMFFWIFPWINYEHLVVTPTSFTHHHYSSNARAADTVEFADLDRIEFVQETRIRAKGDKQERHYLDCFDHSGERVYRLNFEGLVEWSIKNDDDYGASQKIVRYASAAGADYVNKVP